MTTEAAVAKLMWILGQTRDFDEAEAPVLPPRGAGHPLRKRKLIPETARPGRAVVAYFSGFFPILSKNVRGGTAE